MTVKTKAKLISLYTDGDGIIRFCLELGEDIDFNPGQYGRITIEEPEYTDDRGNSRTLTIVSAGSTRKIACFATRSGKSAFKRTLLELEINSALDFTGPFGKFITIGESDACVFIAGGIGITPVAALFHKLPLMEKKPEVIAFHLNESNSTFPLKEELHKTSLSLDNVKYVRIVSGKNKIEGVENGNLDSEMIRKHVPEKMMSEAIFYVSGPNSLVKDVKPLLLELGISDERIRVEIFPGY